jgi:hypothetical protein
MIVRHILFQSILALLLLVWSSACTVSRAGATPGSVVALDAYGAQHLSVTPPVRVTIVSEFPGEIQVISYPAAEVAVDSITTGQDNSVDGAALQALQANDGVDLQFQDGGVLIRAQSNEVVAARLLLHVRVPNGSSVTVDSPQAAANVSIAGETRDVRVQVRGGDITVRGATGDLTLKTGQGSIIVDQHDNQHHTLELRASEGGIALFALNARVQASTTNGSIQFIGTLREMDGNSSGNALSEFTVKGQGNVSVALPSHAKFRFRAFGGASVIADLAREAEPCGLVSLPNYDFRRRLLNTGDAGLIEVSGAFTNTSQVQGVYGNGILYFETDRNVISIFDPSNPPARSDGPSAHGTVGDCGRLNNANLSAANIDFTLRADSGTIWIHQINMR